MTLCFVSRRDKKKNNLNKTCRRQLEDQGAVKNIRKRKVTLLSFSWGINFFLCFYFWPLLDDVIVAEGRKDN